MALSKKAIKGSGLIQLRNSDSSSDGTNLTQTETWTGDYADLIIKRDAVCLTVKGTSLTPTEAGQGELRITREISLTGGARPPSVETIELIWQELRQAVELHPFFAELTPDEVKEVKRLADDPDATISEVSAATGAIELYELLTKGVTEYSLGVPVVRKTTTNVAGNLGSGNAWYRENPPVSIAGGWQFLKTADERRATGRRFDRVEEWTGAKEWSVILYPPPS